MRNNAPPMILSSTPSRYFLQYYQHYSLQYATRATQVSTPPTLATLAHHPRHPHWYVIHASTPPMQTHRPRQQTSHASTLLTTPTLSQRACHFSNPWVSKQLSNSKRKFKQFLHLVFIYTAAFTFQAFLSIFIKVGKTATEKLNFFSGKQFALFKRRLYFQKQMPNFLEENCFLILVSFRPFYIF